MLLWIQITMINLVYTWTALKLFDLSNCTTQKAAIFHEFIMSSVGTPIFQLKFYSKCDMVIQDLYRIYTGFIRDLYGDYTWFIQDLYRVYTGFIRGLYRIYTGFIVYTGFIQGFSLGWLFKIDECYIVCLLDPKYCQ